MLKDQELDRAVKQLTLKDAAIKEKYASPALLTNDLRDCKKT